MNRRWFTPLDGLKAAAVPLTGAGSDYDALLGWIGDAELVLLGEASHGTHEFYDERARITRRLIDERGFSAVAVEADWPDAYLVNRYVQGDRKIAGANNALREFRRFPTWMWRNADVLAFVAWLYERNIERAPSERAGFYGLDLYSLRSSMQAVVSYLESVDPEAAKAARASYACFDQFGGDTETYAWATARLGNRSCEDAVVEQLLALQKREVEFARDGATEMADEYFYAEQNARLARNAEQYYRTMFKGRAASWNVRDEHMAETLEELLEHLRRRGQQPKVVVWAHNSHLGDARATQLGANGELNLGQLVRERHGDNAKLIGFTTYSGTVTAASDWGEVAERKRVRPALADSYEEFFHTLGIPRFFLSLRSGDVVVRGLPAARLERAIGVIYRPDTERQSHYFSARLAEQFDAVLHFDDTHAVEPLERTAGWEAGEVPETFPSGV